jgi:hypothetical protein
MDVITTANPAAQGAAAAPEPVVHEPVAPEPELMALRQIRQNKFDNSKACAIIYDANEEGRRLGEGGLKKAFTKMIGYASKAASVGTKIGDQVINSPAIDSWSPDSGNAAPVIHKYEGTAKDVLKHLEDILVVGSRTERLITGKSEGLRALMKWSYLEDDEATYEYFPIDFNTPLSSGDAQRVFDTYNSITQGDNTLQKCIDRHNYLRGVLIGCDHEEQEVEKLTGELLTCNTENTALNTDKQGLAAAAGRATQEMNRLQGEATAASVAVEAAEEATLRASRDSSRVQARAKEAATAEAAAATAQAAAEHRALKEKLKIVTEGREQVVAEGFGLRQDRSPSPKKKGTRAAAAAMANKLRKSGTKDDAAAAAAEDEAARIQAQRVREVLERRILEGEGGQAGLEGLNKALDRQTEKEVTHGDRAAVVVAERQRKEAVVLRNSGSEAGATGKSGPQLTRKQSAAAIAARKRNRLRQAEKLATEAKAKAAQGGGRRRRSKSKKKPRRRKTRRKTRRH